MRRRKRSRKKHNKNSICQHLVNDRVWINKISSHFNNFIHLWILSTSHQNLWQNDFFFSPTRDKKRKREIEEWNPFEHVITCDARANIMFSYKRPCFTMANTESIVFVNVPFIVRWKIQSQKFLYCNNSSESRQWRALYSLFPPILFLFLVFSFFFNSRINFSLAVFSSIHVRFYLSDEKWSWIFRHSSLLVFFFWGFLVGLLSIHASPLMNIKKGNLHPGNIYTYIEKASA